MDGFSRGAGALEGVAAFSVAVGAGGTEDEDVIALVAALRTDGYAPNSSSLYVNAVRGVMTHGGDGVYRSTDAGRTWKTIGLVQTQHIARIAPDASGCGAVM